jgi:ABC-type phosphate/phosphonate transport system permease subunit
MRMFAFPEVLTLLGLLWGLVASVDALSAWIRHRVVR